MTVSNDDDNAALARLGITPAEPFKWDNEPHIGTADATDNDKQHKNFSQNGGGATSSGLDLIKEFVVNNDNSNDNEKQILKTLLKDASIDISAVQSSNTPSSSSSSSSSNITNDNDFFRDVNIKGLSDRAVAELTVESRTSLFGSILRLFDPPRIGEEGYPAAAGNSGSNDKSTKTDETPPVAQEVTNTDPMIMKEPILSTAEIVRSVHLTAKPGEIPVGMDSKEYTVAVLNFFSSYVPYLHENESEYRATDESLSSSKEGWDQLRNTLPILPLLKSTNPEESLELRCYGRVKPLIKFGATERKEYPDAMDRGIVFRQKVLNLERIFSSSLPFSASTFTTNTTQSVNKSQSNENDLPFAFQRYVPRRKLVPHIEGGCKEELTLMISGHMQQPSSTPGPKAKSGKGKATTIATPAKSKSALDHVTTPAKRKVDSTVTDTSLHQSKKVKETDA